MIVQASEPVQFTDASRIVVPLQAPSAPQTVLALAMLADKPCAMPVADEGGMRRFWRCANTVGSTHLWYRIPGPLGGVQSLTIETAQKITGSAVAIETAGLPALSALQTLSDLIAGAA